MPFTLFKFPTLFGKKQSSYKLRQSVSMKTKYTYTTERRQTHCHLPAAPSSFARSLTEGAVHHTLPFFAALRQGLKKGLAKRDCVKDEIN